MSGQLDLFEGKRLKCDGLNAVEDKGIDFVEKMRLIAKDIVRRNGSVSADDLRVVSDDFGIFPHHPNAWGAIFRGEEWLTIGRKQSEYPDNHAREIRVWTLRNYQSTPREEVK